MAATQPDIMPRGMNQRELIDVLYMIVSSLEGICQKLDADGTVTDTDYEALCITALFNIVISDCRGNRINLATTETTALGPTHEIGALGISDPALLGLMYSITNCLLVLTTKCDADNTFNTYKSLAYTATMLHMIDDGRNTPLGNSGGFPDGSAYYFKPGGVTDQRMLVDWLYNVINSIGILCKVSTTAGLDNDTAVADTNYYALWYTANITLTVENSDGNLIGN